MLHAFCCNNATVESLLTLPSVLYPFFLPSPPTLFLFPDSERFFRFRACIAQHVLLDEFAKPPARIKAIQCLRPGALHFYRVSAGWVYQRHAGFTSIHFLPARTAAADKMLFQVFLTNAATSHTFLKRLHFFRGYAKVRHG